MSAHDQETYDELYRSAPALWSGRPNRQLVVEASRLPSGRALDAGSGEGGWQVTAVDFSTVALERAAAAAAARGLGERIEWVHADLGSWSAPEGSFDLVTAHYLHASWVDRSALFRRLADAVAPGGTLLVVGHLLVEGDEHDHGHGHGHDGGVGDGRGQLHERDPAAFYTAEEVMAALDPAQWQDVVTETRDRDPAAADRTGNHVPDTVLVARRLLGAR